MGSFLGMPSGRASSSRHNRQNSSLRSGRRVTSVDHLEKLAELQRHITRRSLAEFKRCLESFPYDLDASYPFQWARPTLRSLGAHHHGRPSREPVSLCLLHVAASRGRPDVLRLLLSAGASPGVLDSNGECALHHAATNPGSFRALPFHSRADQSRLVASWTSGSHRCVEILCESVMSGGAIEVDVRSRLDGATPLHRACESGRDASAAVLLARGADPGALNAYGETPAAMALIAGHEGVFRRFLELGLIRDRLDAMPYILHTSVNAYTEAPTPDKFSIVLDILRLDVDLNEQDQLGNTPLHYAAAGCMVDYQLVSVLLTRGSNADLRNKMGRTPLMEFFFSHQNHTNTANVKSVVLLAANMTTTPGVPPGQGFQGRDLHHGNLRSRLYEDIARIVREVAGRLPSLGHLCRQALRRAVRPHRLGDPEVVRALPLPEVLRKEVASRLDPESYCAHLVSYLIEEGRPAFSYLDILNCSSERKDY